MFKSLVLGRPIAAEILVERIPLEDIPEGSDNIANWLHENYHHKVLCLKIVINSWFLANCYYFNFNDFPSIVRLFICQKTTYSSGQNDRHFQN